LVETLEKLGEKIHIDTLVSDASEAIRNAFLLVFSAGKLIIMCWAHVRRNVVKHLHLVDEDYKDEIMVDIDALQLASNNENFDKAKDLFIKKWNSKKQNEFINYMKSMWLSSHQNWYEGVAFNTPSHKNGLESHNLVIKKEETFRERMPLPRFIQQCIDSVEKWSKQYANKDREFIITPTIELQHWTHGYHWAKSNKQIATRELGNIIEYYCPVGEQTKVTEEQIETVQELRWNTFDQFKKRASSVWKVTLPSDASNEKWRAGKCTCPFFLKKYMCKHIIGLAIRLKSAKPPPAAKDVPIGEKRKRGRPKQAKKALIVD
jgi:hypothetical protein